MPETASKCIIFGSMTEGVGICPKTIELNGQSASIWKLTNQTNGIAYKGVLLANGDFFVPVNGGRSGLADYDTMAHENVEETLKYSPDRRQVVKSSFTLLGVMCSGKSKELFSTYQMLMGISGIYFEGEGKFLHQMTVSYPKITVEPVIE